MSETRSGVEEDSSSKPIFFHITEIAEWTPEIAHQVANIQPNIDANLTFRSLPAGSPLKFKKGDVLIGVDE